MLLKWLTCGKFIIVISRAIEFSIPLEILISVQLFAHYAHYVTETVQHFKYTDQSKYHCKRDTKGNVICAVPAVINDDSQTLNCIKAFTPTDGYV